MNVRYAQQHRFYAETAAIESLAEELAGRDFSEFFRRYVAGTDDLPFEEILQRGGLAMSFVGGSGGKRLLRISDAHVSGLPSVIREAILTGK
jgi:hypothetical protein